MLATVCFIYCTGTKWDTSYDAIGQITSGIFFQESTEEGSWVDLQIQVES